MPASGIEITHDAETVMEQIFMTGPLHDREISSKAGRDQLHALGALERSMGYNTLNAYGIQLAVAKRIHFRKRRSDPTTLAAMLRAVIAPAVPEESLISG